MFFAKAQTLSSGTKLERKIKQLQHTAAMQGVNVPTELTPEQRAKFDAEHAKWQERQDYKESIRLQCLQAIASELKSTAPNWDVISNATAVYKALD